MTGISKTLAMFDALSKLSVDAIAVVKAGGFRLMLLPKLVDAVQEISLVVADAPQALPELVDLDAGESAQIGAAAYKLVKDIMAALA